MFWASLCTLKCMCVRVGVGGVVGPHLVLLLFFPGQRVPLLAVHPIPFFPLVLFPMATGKCGPLKSPPWLLCTQSWGPPQKCHLSQHAFPCSKQAGRQQGLSRLSDPGAERPGRKGVQPVGCKALIGTC